MENNTLTTTKQTDLRKLLSIFFLGQIIGLPTLNGTPPDSILQYHDIKSNSRQICYKNICKSLTNKTIHDIFSTLFEKKLNDKLTNLSQKDPSAWSRGFTSMWGKLPTRELSFSFKMFFVQESRYFPIIYANKRFICLKLIKKG